MPNIVKCFFDVKKSSYYMFSSIEAFCSYYLFSSVATTCSPPLDLIPWQFQNTMFRPMKLIKRDLSWMTMHYNDLVGGFRLLGDSLGGVATWSGFQCEWF